MPLSSSAYSWPPVGPDGLETVHVDDKHAVGVWRNDVLVIWRGETEARAVERLRGVLNRVAMQQGMKLGILQYVLPDAPIPTSKEVREQLALMLQEARRTVACSAMVAPGTGFRIAAGRAMVTGLTMLVRPGFPHVVFSTLEEAAEWQSRLLPRSTVLVPTATEIVSRATSLLQRAQAAAKDAGAAPRQSGTQELP